MSEIRKYGLLIPDPESSLRQYVLLKEGNDIIVVRAGSEEREKIMAYTSLLHHLQRSSSLREYVTKLSKKFGLKTDPRELDKTIREKIGSDVIGHIVSSRIVDLTDIVEGRWRVIETIPSVEGAVNG